MNVAVPPASVVIRPLIGRDGDAGRVVVDVGDRHVGGVHGRCSSRRVLVAGGRDDRVAMSPSSRSSSTPVTVTVWAMFQLAAVKVRLAGGDGAFGRVAGARPIVTSAVGWLFSTTVNVAVPPASVVSPLIAETVIPAVSLSVLVTATSASVQRRCSSRRLLAAARRDDRCSAMSPSSHGVVHAGDRHRLRRRSSWRR